MRDEEMRRACSWLLHHPFRCPHFPAWVPTSPPFPTPALARLFQQSAWEETGAGLPHLTWHPAGLQAPWAPSAHRPPFLDPEAENAHRQLSHTWEPLWDHQAVGGEGQADTGCPGARGHFIAFSAAWGPRGTLDSPTGGSAPPHAGGGVGRFRGALRTGPELCRERAGHFQR